MVNVIARFVRAIHKPEGWITRTPCNMGRVMTNALSCAMTVKHQACHSVGILPQAKLAQAESTKRVCVANPHSCIPAVGMNLRFIAAMTIMVITAFAFTTPANAQDITTGLVGHWKLDEISGSGIIDYASNNDGTLQGGLDPATDSVIARIGRGLNFDGIDDHVNIGNDASISFDGTKPFTFSVWVNPASIDYGNILSKYGTSSGARQFAMYIDANNLPACLREVSPYTVTGVTAMEAGSWYHFVCRYDGTNLSVYVNGVQENTAASGSTNNPSTDTYIGSNANTGDADRQFGGLIDDVRIYNRALDPEDINYLYESFDGNIKYDTGTRVPKYFNGDDWVAMGRSKYIPNAVEFDGANDYLTNPTAIGTADTTTGTLSAWFKANDLSVDKHLLNSKSGRINVFFDQSIGQFRIAGENTSNTNVLDLRTSALGLDTSGWHHVLASWDLTGPTPVTHLYVDDVSDKNEATATADELIYYTDIDHSVGANTVGNNRWDGFLADIWFDPDVYIDLSVEANRRKFIDADGNPVYLGATGSIPTGSAPNVFLSGDTATWHTNKGSGNDFTENGTLTDSPTNPGEVFRDPVIANGGNAWVQDATRLDQPVQLDVSGIYAYVVSSGGNSLTVVDISDPLNPVIANSGNAWVQDATRLSSPRTIDVSGDYAYVGSNSSTFTVVDISDPLNPVIANSGNAWFTDATRLNGPRSVEVSGNYAYVASGAGNSLTVVDISDPLNPVIANGGNAWVQDAVRLGYANAVDVSGNYAYVGSYNSNSLTVVDISDPLNPVIANGGNAWVQDATRLNGVEAVLVDGNYAYVASAAGDSLTVVDISDPLNPVIANGGNAWVQDATKLDFAQSLSLSGNYAYVVAHDFNALTVVDISDPLNPVIANNGNGWVQDNTKLAVDSDVKVAGNYAYVTARGGNALTVVDIDHRGQCSNPARFAGTMIYNANSQVLQYCDGENWQAMGPVPGAGSGGCSNPTRAEGSLVYNKDFSVMQYCDGDEWVRIGKKCPFVGNICDDGTVYAGLSPDGNIRMYTTPCNEGRTWDGSKCNGSSGTYTWNQSFTHTDYATTGATSDTNGDANTALILTVDADETVGGFQTHEAANLCATKSAFGHSDWHLPAIDELSVLYNNKDEIGDLNSRYYSSTEYNEDNAKSLHFGTGSINNFTTKNGSYRVRCVRK